MKFITRPLALALIAILTFMPIVVVLKGAFWHEGHLSLQLLKDAFGPANTGMWTVILRTVFIAACAAAIGGLLAIPAAWLSARTDSVLAGIFPYLAIMPLLTPSNIVTYAWMQLMMIAGSPSEPLLPFFNMPFTIFVLSLYYMPIAFYGAFAAFRSSDPLAEKAALLYHRPLKVWWSVTLPKAAPYIIASLAFMALLCFTEYGIPALLTVNTFVSQLFVYMSANHDINSAFVFSLLMFAVIAIAGWFLFRRLPIDYFFGRSSSERNAERIPIGNWKYVGGAYLAFILTITVILPIVALLIKAFSLTGDPYSLEPSYFSGLKYFREAIDISRADIQLTITVAIAAAIASVLIALPLARLVVNIGGRFVYVLFVLLALPFLIPGTAFAIGIIRIYNTPAFNAIYTSPVLMFITYTGKFLPIAILILAGGMMRVGNRRELIAKIHGVSDMRAYLEVFLPLLQFEFWLAFLGVMIFTVGELGAAILVSNPGATTITASLYIMMHYGNEERVAALSLIQVAIVLVPIAIFSLIYFGNRKRDITNA